MANTNPEVGMYRMSCLESLVCKLLGSFQGNSGSNPSSAQIRGSWFTVVRQGSGQYRVTLTAPPLIASLGSATTNVGLVSESRAWVVSESMSAGTAPVKYTATQTGRVVAAGTFDIWVYDIAGAALYDVTTADRVFFELGWKTTGFTP